MSYSYGAVPRLTFNTYSDAAQTTPADPTLLTLYITDPDGVETTAVWPSGTIVNDAVGEFHYDVTEASTAPGHWSFHWVATGAVATGEPDGFDIDPKYGPWITLNDVKADLNITGTTNDTELRSVIDAACAILENHPGYTVADHVKTTALPPEWHDGGTDRLYLKHYPVLEITSVTEYNDTTAQVLAAEPWDSVAFTSYGYVLDSEAGRLERISGGTPVNFTGRVKVVYTAGVTTVPANLRLAALLLVEHLWQTQRGGMGPGLPAGLDVDETVSPFGPSFALPNRVLELLTPYAKAPAVA